jgi:hypothetical protein
VGWYGFKGEKYVYYSEDESKRVKNPRLHVLETATAIMFKLAGGISESISYIDPEDKYVVVYVSAPDLRPLFVSALSIYAAGAYMGDISIPLGGMTIAVGRKVEYTGLYAAMMILGSIGNYQYEIYGQPVGELKRQYSGVANDTELQQDIGMVVENKFEGFICHTPTDCQNVAEFEMMMTKGQRNRVKVKKIAHLQDEIGDTLTVTHPYSLNPVKVFVTNLTRKYSPGSGGYFIDEIEGWVC